MNDPKNILLEVTQYVYDMIILHRIDGEKPYETLERILRQHVPNSRQCSEADWT
jgi:hypothetical protein